jgi:hypothetical protein
MRQLAWFFRESLPISFDRIESLDDIAIRKFLHHANRIRIRMPDQKQNKSHQLFHQRVPIGRMAANGTIPLPSTGKLID